MKGLGTLDPGSVPHPGARGRRQTTANHGFVRRLGAAFSVFHGEEGFRARGRGWVANEKAPAGSVCVSLAPHSTDGGWSVHCRKGQNLTQTEAQPTPIRNRKRTATTVYNLPPFHKRRTKDVRSASTAWSRTDAAPGLEDRRVTSHIHGHHLSILKQLL